jgi:hypothetical protein
MKYTEQLLAKHKHKHEPTYLPSSFIQHTLQTAKIAASHTQDRHVRY